MIPRYIPTFSFNEILRSYVSYNNHKGELSKRLKQLYGVNHVFLFNKARTGLFLALLSQNDPGEVILPAYTCIVVPSAITAAGYIPKFVDVNYESFNASTVQIEKAISKRTKAIIPTHIFGLPCEVDKISQLGKERGILVIEDAAGAIGALYKKKLVGTSGDVSIISFDRSKVISGWAGGALLTNDDDMAYKINGLIRKLDLKQGNCIAYLLKATGAYFGMKRYIYPSIYLIFKLIRGEFWETGIPQKVLLSHIKLLDEKSSKLISLQIQRYKENINRRQEIANFYSANIACPIIEKPEILDEAYPAWIMYPIKVRRKRAFFKYIQKRGIDLNWNFSYCAAESYGFFGFKNASEISKRVLGLPTSPSLSDREVEYIVECVNSAS